MINTKQWSWDTPRVAGLYLVCHGDIETAENIGLFVLNEENVLYPKNGTESNIKDGFNIESLKNGSYKYAQIK